MRELSHHDYFAGHPWYYFLGGSVPTINEIKAAAIASGYKGYLAEEIEVIGRKQEPQKSTAIKSMRYKIEGDLHKDISRYHQCARKLRARRSNKTGTEEAVCSDIHTAISLKFNHIYNGFANWKTLDNLPHQQTDLLDLLA